MQGIKGRLCYNYDMDKRPIGVFDSGIGGLTVVREIIKTLPSESIIYVGDTARVPYGTRGKKIITQFATELTKHLLKQNVKAIVVACNTISATCLPQIQKMSPVPVIGVIMPTIAHAVAQNLDNIGIIGTRATIASGFYESKIRKYNKSAQITSSACPLFVPLTEEGMIQDKATYLIAKEYLSPLIKKKVNAVILGCTHYPLLKPIIRKIMGSSTLLIDSAGPTAKALKTLLEKKKIQTKTKNPTYMFFVTDDPDKTKDAAADFLGNGIKFTLKKVTI